MCLGPRGIRRAPNFSRRPFFFHRLQRWVLGVTGGRRHNQACSAGDSCYPLPYASRAPSH
ncbi:hypothetical protein F3J14_01050 [Burkholderia sp. Tr-862]|nr:hypothetical protein [Burkholderia sp. Tr-862]